jgi:hypothetical protein
MLAANLWERAVAAKHPDKPQTTASNGPRDSGRFRVALRKHANFT